jgi:hypothetical protein
MSWRPKRTVDQAAAGSYVSLYTVLTFFRTHCFPSFDQSREYTASHDCVCAKIVNGRFVTQQTRKRPCQNADTTSGGIANVTL